MARPFLILALALLAMPLASAQQQTRLQEDWVVCSLRTMKQHGLLAGGSMVEGHRPDDVLSRYEIAAYTCIAYSHIKKQVGGLAQELEQIKNSPDIEFLREDLDRIKQEIKDLEPLGQDVLALQRLCILYRVELEALGADVEEMMLDLGDLAPRITCQVEESDGATWDAAHRQACRV